MRRREGIGPGDEQWPLRFETPWDTYAVGLASHVERPALELLEGLEKLFVSSRCTD